MAQAKVAIAKSYLDAYSRLPKKQQKKARETLEQFTLDPTSPGLNFERLPGMRDGKVRSLRVDQAYRMIVVQPPRGDVFLAVWVDNHDEAYRWAERKQFEVNPISGVMPRHFSAYSHHWAQSKLIFGLGNRCPHWWQRRELSSLKNSTTAAHLGQATSKAASPFQYRIS